MSSSAPDQIAGIENERIGQPVPASLLVGGVWRDAGDRRGFEVHNPATGESLGDVADATVEDAVSALDAAWDARDAWRAFAPRDRAAVLRRAHDLLRERGERIAAVITLESGKTLAEARAEVSISAEFLEWAIERISDVQGHIRTGSHGGYDIITRYEPIGPSLLISPWNFPLLMPARKLASALAAGCTAIVKPAAETPLTALLLGQVFVDAGVPQGVVSVLPTTRAAEISTAVMSDARLRKVSFTGSTAVGTQLLMQAAPNVISSSMELGGDGPLVVLEAADIEKAARQAIICKFRNAGQTCTTANRIIVHDKIADAFTERFTELASALTVGDGFDAATEVTPMISERQRERSLAMIGEARDGGATILTGGDAIPGGGFFLQPTVVTDLTPEMALAREEIFAPIAAVYRVSSVDEAVAAANATSFGLTAYIFSEDLREALDVADRIESGMVGINRGLLNDVAAPFGGVKSSGLGREGGPDTLHEFMEVKYIALDR